MGGNGGICRIVLLPAPITASGRPDVWGAALGNIRRAYKRIAGHCGKYVGIFRRRLDGISQRLRKVNTSQRRAQTGVSEGLELAAVGTRATADEGAISIDHDCKARKPVLAYRSTAPMAGVDLQYVLLKPGGVDVCPTNWRV